MSSLNPHNNTRPTLEYVDIDSQGDYQAILNRLQDQPEKMSLLKKHGLFCSFRFHTKKTRAVVWLCLFSEMSAATEISELFPKDGSKELEQASKHLASVFPPNFVVPATKTWGYRELEKLLTFWNLEFASKQGDIPSSSESSSSEDPMNNKTKKGKGSKNNINNNNDEKNINNNNNDEKNINNDDEKNENHENQAEEKEKIPLRPIVRLSPGLASQLAAVEKSREPKAERDEEALEDVFAPSFFIMGGGDRPAQSTKPSSAALLALVLPFVKQRQQQLLKIAPMMPEKRKEKTARFKKRRTRAQWNRVKLKNHYISLATQSQNVLERAMVTHKKLEQNLISVPEKAKASVQKKIEASQKHLSELSQRAAQDKDNLLLVQMAFAGILSITQLPDDSLLLCWFSIGRDLPFDEDPQELQQSLLLTGSMNNEHFFFNSCKISLSSSHLASLDKETINHFGFGSVVTHSLQVWSGSLEGLKGPLVVTETECSSDLPPCVRGCLEDRVLEPWRLACVALFVTAQKVEMK